MYRQIIRVLLACFLLLNGAGVSAKNTDGSRLPPSVSHQQTMRLFAQQRYEQAYKAAVHRYEWGDDQMHYPLGYMLRHGRGVPANKAQAREHLSIAAQHNNAQAQYQLAEMLRLGEGGRLNPAQACAWYQKARKSLSDAAFQAAICELDAGRERLALQHLHALATQNHLSASKRLLHYYRQHGLDDVLAQPAYQKAISAWLQQQDKRARTLANDAIAQGDYRAYAVLGESLRRTPNHNPELVRQHVDLGRLYGSQLPRFAAGQRLKHEGYAQAACQFFAQAFQAGFAQAGRQMGQCVDEALLASGTADKTACDYYGQAFFAGDRNSVQDWLQCQKKHKAGAEELAKTYDHAKQLDKNFVDMALSERICASKPSRKLAVGATVTLSSGQEKTVSEPLITCILNQDNNALQVFVPFHGWLLNLSSYDLALPIERHGLPLATLTRQRVRELLLHDNAALMPLELSAERDKLRLKTTDNVEVRLDYHDNGQLRRYVETCLRCRDDNFTWRRQRLQEQFGAPLVGSSSDTFEDRHWQIQDWDIQLMMKPNDGQMREIYSAR